MRLKTPKDPTRMVSLNFQGEEKIKWRTLIIGSFAFGLLFSWGDGWAQQGLTLKLKTIEQKVQQEKEGDELYISVTEFPAEGRPQLYQIPSFPAHWLSKYLVNVKDVVLWQRAVANCEPVDLLISLVEKDFPPWNVDDLLGTVKLKVTCQNGEPVKNWVIPNPKITAKLGENQNAFAFTGDKAHYNAVFEVKVGEVKDNSQVKDNMPSGRWLLPTSK